MYQAFFKTVLLGLTVFILTSCDKDFNEIGADIVGDDHFLFETHFDATLTARTVSTGPVESRNLPINPLGIYNNPAFGRTVANFATQVELASVNPTFDAALNPVVEKVVLYIPYFSELESSNDTSGNTYVLDSIFGAENGVMKLSVFQNGYFLRDIEFEGGEQQAQRFYTDQNDDFFQAKVGSRLNTGDAQQNDNFAFSKSEIVEVTGTGEDEVTTRSAPGMRLQLDVARFQQLIFNAPAGALQNNNAFKEYFRGLYFMCEPGSAASNTALALLNFKGGKITVTYKQDTSTSNDTRIEKTLVLNLTGNTASLQTIMPTTAYAAALNQTSGVNSRLWVKGGEGSVAVIDLFGDSDSYGYSDDNDATDGNLYDGPTVMGPNGVPDELDDIKNKGWLINEANLTFNIDQLSLQDGLVEPIKRAVEPRRLYLYDVNNRRPIIDYTFDGTTASDPKLQKFVFGGLIEEEPGENGRGIKYKVRITNYVRNLVQNDSTNVKLGLSVTEAINITTVAKLRNTTAANADLNGFIPTASVMNPLGTVLYGNDLNIPEAQRLKLEIYYTKPE